LKKGLKMLLIFALYVLAVILVSLLPGKSVSPWRGDNIGHFLAYTGIAVLACLAFDSRIARISALFFAVILGAVLEWGQSFVPGRDMSLIDGIANTLGVLGGTVLFRLRGRHFARYVERFIRH
jgi:VanZ family protein